jgi:hypothetical protein
VQHFDVPKFGEEGPEAEMAQMQLDDQRAQYFAEVSQSLVPTIPTKFWA